jgi:hypothetical protein
MKSWKKFELAVRDFVAALDPNATVRHNVKLPDLDTGKPRQRDVWVESTICNIFPVKVLISCKRWSRKINEQDVDTFIGELRSSGAHKGVLYTFTGYTSPAIDKGKKLGISCCKLYNNRPPDVPESLVISFYCCRPTYRLRLNSEAKVEWGNITFDEVFSIREPFENGTSRTLLERLNLAFLQEEDLTVQKALESHFFPRGWQVGIQVTKPNCCPLTIYLEGKWRVFRAKIEGHLLNGSYSFTDNMFLGSLSSPWIDTQRPEPGPEWEVVSDPPESIEAGIGLMIFKGGSCVEGLKEHYSNLKIKDLCKNKVNSK